MLVVILNNLLPTLHIKMNNGFSSATGVKDVLSSEGGGGGEGGRILLDSNRDVATITISLDALRKSNND